MAFGLQIIRDLKLEDELEELNGDSKAPSHFSISSDLNDVFYN